MLGSLSVASVGCGDESDGSGPPRVIITRDGFEPSDLRLEVGQTVAFVNRSPNYVHSARDERQGDIDGAPGPGPTDHSGGDINRASRKGFATHSLFPRETQRVVFPVAKTYEFRCSFHPDMKGTIEVVE
jgi:plastocyanin